VVSSNNPTIQQSNNLKNATDARILGIYFEVQNDPFRIVQFLDSWVRSEYGDIPFWRYLATNALLDFWSELISLK
jgi:hypothetical protein